MDALFSDSSSWQTTFPGICNVSVLESDICSYTIYEASVQNWPGMYCNDMIAHMYKIPLTEQPNSIFSRAFFCFITSLLKKLQHKCAVISETAKSLWTGSHITLPYACYVSHSTARIMQDSAAIKERESHKFKALLKCDHNRWRRLMCTKIII